MEICLSSEHIPLSSSAVFAIMQQSGPPGIWPQDWGGQRGTCDLEGHSVTTRRPLTVEQDYQSTSAPRSHSRRQLSKRRDKRTASYLREQIILSELRHCQILSCFMSWPLHTSLIGGWAASWGVEDVVDSGSRCRVQGRNFWGARAWKNVLIDRL